MVIEAWLPQLWDSRNSGISDVGNVADVKYKKRKKERKRHFYSVMNYCCSSTVNMQTSDVWSQSAIHAYISSSVLIKTIPLMPTCIYLNNIIHCKPNKWLLDLHYPWKCLWYTQIKISLIVQMAPLARVGRYDDKKQTVISDLCNDLLFWWKCRIKIQV